MDTIHVDVWLYGPIARYAGDQSKGSHANLDLEMPAGSTMHDLLERLGVPSEERGITFVNGKLAALPGLEADLGLRLEDGDRVGISHRRSMWPFQYRFGANLTSEIQESFRQRQDRGIHHAYTGDEPQEGIEESPETGGDQVESVSSQ
jgi:sulfur carrier protein ThiS